MKKTTKIFISNLEHFLNKENIKNFSKRGFFTYKRGDNGGIVFSKFQKGKKIKFSLDFKKEEDPGSLIESFKTYCTISTEPLDNFEKISLNTFLTSRISLFYSGNYRNLEDLYPYLNGIISDLFRYNNYTTLVIDVLISEIPVEKIIQHKFSSSFKIWAKKNIENLKNFREDLVNDLTFKLWLEL